jgi:anti-sigma regulatory factor (Ser/Thr protein kinase)
MDKHFTNYLIEDRSYVAYVKREIHKEIAQHKFSEIKASKIDIIVSEITSNLIKHTQGGELLYRIYNVDDYNSAFEIICIDQGPGIMDTARVMKDGMSTSGTLGHGLGAIERLSNQFNIYSMPGWGTILYSKVLAKEQKTVRKSTIDLEVRGLCVPKVRETMCGDGYAIKRNGHNVQIFFGDGLGHGERAHEAVSVATDFFLACDEKEPTDILKGMHERVRRTRGLVATVAVLDAKQNEWRLCGVGNIMTRLYSGIVFKNYMSYNGTIGLNLPNSMNASVHPAEKNQHLIMCSDGLRTRWDLNKYPTIFKCDNFVLAAALYKDFSRGTDDASVLIAKVYQP